MIKDDVIGAGGTGTDVLIVGVGVVEAEVGARVGAGIGSGTEGQKRSTSNEPRLAYCRGSRSHFPCLWPK